MNRKAILLSAIALTTVLLASSIIVVSQAQQPTENTPEYVGYSLTHVPGVTNITSIDTSGAPGLLIIESNETMSQGNITIGDKVYTYAQDFDYNGKVHTELNATSGEGFVRIEKTFTFNVANDSTLKSWLVLHITGLFIDPATGQATNVENIATEGTFKLTGTGTFSQADGFGLENNGHHFGFIKGWPL